MATIKKRSYYIYFSGKILNSNLIIWLLRSGGPSLRRVYCVCNVVVHGPGQNWVILGHHNLSSSLRTLIVLSQTVFPSRFNLHWQPNNSIFARRRRPISVHLDFMCFRLCQISDTGFFDSILCIRFQSSTFIFELFYLHTTEPAKSE
jgi:hypothetical protein